MGNIKEYKQLTYLETFNGEIFSLEDDLEKVTAMLNDDRQFISLWDTLVNKKSIKRAFRKELDEIEQMILLINDVNIRKQIQNAVRERRENWLRVNRQVLRNLYDKFSKDKDSL